MSESVASRNRRLVRHNLQLSAHEQGETALYEGVFYAQGNRIVFSNHVEMTHSVGADTARFKGYPLSVKDGVTTTFTQHGEDYALPFGQPTGVFVSNITDWDNITPYGFILFMDRTCETFMDLSVYTESGWICAEVPRGNSSVSLESVLESYMLTAAYLIPDEDVKSPADISPTLLTGRMSDVVRLVPPPAIVAPTPAVANQTVSVAVEEYLERFRDMTLRQIAELCVSLSSDSDHVEEDSYDEESYDERYDVDDEEYCGDCSCYTCECNY